MNKWIISTRDQIAARSLGSWVFTNELKGNLDGPHTCPVMSALYRAMCQTELSFDEWVAIIKAALPEVENLKQLNEMLETGSFTYVLGNKGEEQLRNFCNELLQKQ